MRAAKQKREEVNQFNSEKADYDGKREKYDNSV
jgi:hypothetical protein